MEGRERPLTPRQRMVEALDRGEFYDCRFYTMSEVARGTMTTPYWVKKHLLKYFRESGIQGRRVIAGKRVKQLMAEDLRLRKHR